MLKKIIVILTISILLITLLCVKTNAKSFERFQSIYEKIKNDFLNDTEFLKEYRNNHQEAMKHIIAKSKWIFELQFKEKNRNQIIPLRSNPDYPGSSFPRFKQKNDYYCGPAAALTALYFQGSAHKVSGRSYDEKQDTLARHANTNTSGTVVWKLTRAINRYSYSRYFYDTALSPKEVDDLLYDSLENGNAPILHSLMELMPYYHGRRGGHYVTIVYYDWRAPADSNGIDVMDNNNMDEFFGINSISFRDIMNIIDEGRYIIAAPNK